jgi:hypothetical protein
MSELQATEVTVKTPDMSQTADVDIGAVEKTPVVREEEPKKDEGVELLRRQLNEKQREVEENRRQKTEMEQFAFKAAQEIKNYQVQAQDSQLIAFTNAIATFERDAEMLERDYANTLAEGDYSKAAKLQRHMSQVESKLIQLAQGREAIQERLEHERRVLEQQRRQPSPRYEQQPTDPIEAQIQSVKSPTSQAWLRSHRDVLSDPVKTSLMTAAHHETTAMGIEPDTPEYFAHIESKVYDSEPVKTSTYSTRQRQAMAAAPVSRTNSAQTFRSGQTVTMTLSPAERQTARDMDMSDEEYLEGKLYYANKGMIGL